MPYTPNGQERFRRFRIAGPVLTSISNATQATLLPQEGQCVYCDTQLQRVALGSHTAAYGCPNGCEVNVRASLAHHVTDAEELPSR